MATWLERLAAMARGDLPHPPIATLVGFRCRSVGSGEAESFTTLELKINFLRPF